MGIGFQSFGGKLTGDKEPPEQKIKATAEKIEEKEMNQEIEDDKIISYNEVKNK